MLFKAVRELYEKNRIMSCWTHDGRVFMKDWSDEVKMVSSLEDIKDI